MAFPLTIRAGTSGEMTTVLSTIPTTENGSRRVTVKAPDFLTHTRYGIAKRRGNATTIITRPLMAVTAWSQFPACSA
jgi:hypothetical protein